MVRTHLRTEKSPTWFKKEMLCDCFKSCKETHKELETLESEIETTIVGIYENNDSYPYAVIAPESFIGMSYNSFRCEQYSIAKKDRFFSLKGINEHAILRMVKSEPAKIDGCFCADCNKYCHMSIPNLTFQGKEIMVCFSCRNTNAWKWKI